MDGEREKERKREMELAVLCLSLLSFMSGAVRAMLYMRSRVIIATTTKWLSSQSFLYLKPVSVVIVMVVTVCVIVLLPVLVVVLIYDVLSSLDKVLLPATATSTPDYPIYYVLYSPVKRQRDRETERQHD